MAAAAVKLVYRHLLGEFMMCSTPKGSGLTTRVTPIDYGKADEGDYTRMLRRASRRYEARQQARREQETGLEERDED